jgi:hypothetical protein
MTMRIFVSRDAGAVAVGADEVAFALEAAAAKRGLAIEIVRTGSRGLYWLEPMIEVATAQGRVAYGPVTTTDVAAIARSDGFEVFTHPERVMAAKAFSSEVGAGSREENASEQKTDAKEAAYVA